MAYTDPDVTVQFARKFFAKNPGATVRDCMKAANNAHPRVPPMWPVVVEEHRAHKAKKLAAMMDHPTKPSPSGFPALVVPPPEEPEEEMPPIPVAPVAPSKKPDTALPNETKALQEATRHLLAAMRLHNLESVMLTLSDRDEKPKVELEITRRPPSSSLSFEL